MTDVVKALGLMSGTSMDGIDVALIETDGERVGARGPGRTYPYSRARRGLIEQALLSARDLADRSTRPGVLAQAEAMVTQAHAAAVRAFLAETGQAAEEVRVIGFHGQTVLHRPRDRLTVQLGDGHRLAALTGIDTVYDFRAADVAAGGEGAPLVPAYHRALVEALVEALDVRTPVVVVNIGGVANITWVDAGKEPVAFDTGPGNVLIDEWAHLKTGEAMDRDGELARRGRIDAVVLAALLAHPYFERKPPKSLDRLDFSLEAARGLSAADGAATLTAFTVQSLARAQKFLPAPPRAWIVAGGGAKNPMLMKYLAESMQARVTSAEAIGWSAEHMEAEAFAYLAMRSLRGLPLTWPGTTGVPAPQTGGVTVRAPAPALRSSGV